MGNSADEMIKDPVLSGNIPGSGSCLSVPPAEFKEGNGTQTCLTQTFPSGQKLPEIKRGKRYVVGRLNRFRTAHYNAGIGRIHGAFPLVIRGKQVSSC